ncbi:MAG: family 78 glycoside hydrolase catalytic domain [Planctomycetota bacterium]
MNLIHRSLLLICGLMTGLAGSTVASESVDPRIANPQLPDDASRGFAELIDRGYTPLFNGTDLSGWRNPYSHGQATVVDGEIHLKADKKFFLVTERAYTDFRLVVELHLPEGKANSGVMFRCHVDEGARKAVYGYQAECDGSDRCWSGGLFDESRRGWIWPSTQGRSEPQFLEHADESQQFFAQARVRGALRRRGWNRYEITCVKDQITIVLNGIQTVRFRDATDAMGFIGIQHHGEKGQTYRFRNLFIKELPEVPAKDFVRLIQQTPESIQPIEDRATLIDFGKVAYGNLQMPIPKGRGTVNVHFGEKLKGGRVDRSPPGTVRYGTTVIRKGGQRGTWIVPAPVDARNTEQAGVVYANPPAVLTPSRWRSVMPFRWVEFEGLDQDYPFDQVQRRAAFSATWNADAAKFECSDPLLNDIWDLCKYSIKATTFAGVYVDGDRERIPYEADAYLNQLSHYTTDDDVTMAARTFDWLMENGTWPTEWAPHMVLMAHAEWMQNGDVDWLTHRYEALKTKTLLHRVGDDGLVRSDSQQKSRDDIVDWPRQERDGYQFTEINTVVNAFHIDVLGKMAEMAQAVGHLEDANAFKVQRTKALNSFHTQLFDAQSGLFRDGTGTDHSSIHANLFPLAFGLVPDGKSEPIADWLASRGMRCSVYAAQYLLDGLFRNGKSTDALELMLADGDRSWKHMLESGTTITWEAWDLKYKPNQDWNHAWGAAPANLLPRHVLGLQPQVAGGTRMLVRPCVGELSFAKGRVPGHPGHTDVAWTNQGRFSMELSLPDGVVADLNLPASEESVGVQINGDMVSAERLGGRWIVNEPVQGQCSILVLDEVATR